MAVASLASDAATARGDAGGTAASSGAAAGAKFTVTYTVKPAAIYVPAHKDWASVKQKTDTEKLLGDGTLSLSVDAAGRVAGESTGGPLGTAILDGILDGAILSATVRRKDPKDEGLTGTLVATITADKLEGSMKLSEFNAAVVREATVTGKKN
jgi:hypothetical protein